jgi:hypothetical protein
LTKGRYGTWLCNGSRGLVAIAWLILWGVAGCRESGSSAGRQDGGKQDAALGASSDDVSTSGSGEKDEVEPGSQEEAGPSGDMSADLSAQVEAETGKDVHLDAWLETETDAAADDDTSARLDAQVLTDVSMDAPASPSWSAACSAYAQAVCRLTACYPNTLYTQFGSGQSCEDRYGGAACEARVTSAGSHVTPSNLVACAQALATQSCADYLVRFPAECSWQGDRVDGSSCTYSPQCQSGICVPALGTFCGTCRAKVPVGASCPATARLCQDGLICVGSVCPGPVTDAGTCNQSTQWVCTKPGSDGDACISVGQCNWGLACVGGRCVRVKGRGEACTAAIECDPEQDLTCILNASGKGSTCMARSYAGAGESCDGTVGLGCLDNAICKGKDGAPAAIGVCSGAVGNGSSCGTGVACQMPSLCIKGKCQTAADMASSCN